ncbi:hypothetical protein HK405_014064, partial [Cladochytrium tenue]
MFAAVHSLPALARAKPASLNAVAAHLAQSRAVPLNGMINMEAVRRVESFLYAALEEFPALTQYVEKSRARYPAQVERLTPAVADARARLAGLRVDLMNLFLADHGCHADASLRAD